MVFLSITAVAVAVFLIERGHLSALGQMALSGFAETPGSVSSPEPAPASESEDEAIAPPAVTPKGPFLDPLRVTVDLRAASTAELAKVLGPADEPEDTPES